MLAQILYIPVAMTNCMPSRRGAEAIVDYLIEEGEPYLFFGPVGHTNMELMHAAADRDEIEPVMARHELVAAYMAEGWYKVTGKPGVVTAHTAPGLGNMVNAFMTSYVNSSSLIGIVSDVPSEWWGRGAHHEVPPYSNAYEVLDPIVKDSWRVGRHSRLPELLPQAFNSAQNGKPGPTLLSVSSDVLGEQADINLPTRNTRTDVPTPVADLEAIDEAAAAVADAETPVMLAGGGTMLSGASDEVVAFAEALGIPVATTDSSKGIIPEDHELSIGVAGVSGMRSANEVISAADLVLAVGTRFKELTTSGWTKGKPFSFPEQTLIQIDINPREIGKHYPVDIRLQGDAAKTLAQLHDDCARRLDLPINYHDTEQFEFVQEAKANWQAEIEDHLNADDSPVRPERIVKELREALPDDGIVVGDTGRNRGVLVKLWETYEPRTLLMDTGEAVMGYSPGAALGAQLAAPDRPVVSVAGDGGFLMSNFALATAIDYDLPVTFVVFNDAAYMGISDLEESFIGESVGTHFNYPGTDERYDINYASMAADFGVSAERVDDPEDLGAVLETAIEADEPYLVDVVTTKESGDIDTGGVWKIPGRGGDSTSWE